jgi:hypothetical protein
MNNGQQQQLHGLLNNDMLMHMVQRQQQEMSQQRGPQQTFSVPLEHRIGTTATGVGLPHVALLQSLQQQQQHAAGNNIAVLPSPLAGGRSLSNRLLASESPDDLLLRGAGAGRAALNKRKAEDDEMSLTSVRTSNTQATTTLVDKDKVDAAFKSKPQPGKKRADLTDGERQELAKARNREHARQARCATVWDVACLLACLFRLHLHF